MSHWQRCLISLNVCILALLIVSCSPLSGKFHPTQEAYFDTHHYIASDGAKLPLHRWQPQGKPKAILVGVHGFNDYGHFLNFGMKDFLIDNGVELITYDQRGFGAAPEPGKWPGKAALLDDLANVIRLSKAANADIPLFVLGESMGATVTLLTLVTEKDLPVDGIILSAPATWGPSTWPWYQTFTLYVMSYTMPWLTLSGGGIVQPTDHIENWKAWSRDPLVIKSTRVDALWGVSWLMEDAMTQAQELTIPTLLLYGAKDEVIPWDSTAKLVASLNQQTCRIALYPDGWHWLPRDKGAEAVWQDVMSWIESPTAPLPSGADREAREKLVRKVR